MNRELLIRWGVRGLLVSIGVLALLVGVSTVLSERRLQRRYPTAIESLTVDDAPESLARGEHLVRALANCVDCHGDDLGGKVLVDDPLVGTLAGPNLTAGGVGASLTTDDWVRAIVRGVDHEGRALLVMPSNDYASLGREDLRAIVAYVRSVPSVTRSTPSNRLGPMGRVLLTTGRLPILAAEKVEHDAALNEAPQPAPTVVFGEYLAKSGGCLGCHGADLAGGEVGGAPPGSPRAADLRPSAIGRYDDEALERVFRTGSRLDGAALDPLMPWRAVGRMNDVEMAALIAYLRSVPGATGSP